MYRTGIRVILVATYRLERGLLCLLWCPHCWMPDIYRWRHVRLVCKRPRRKGGARGSRWGAGAGPSPGPRRVSHRRRPRTPRASVSRSPSSPAGLRWNWRTRVASGAAEGRTVRGDPGWARRGPPAERLNLRQ